MIKLFSKTPVVIEPTVDVSKICPSCMSRRQLINRVDYRGVLLNAIDITVCIPVTKGTTTYNFAVKSAREQLLKPTIITPFINQNGLTREKLEKQMLSKVTTPYVSFLEEDDEYMPDDLFALANMLTSQAVDRINLSGRPHIFLARTSTMRSERGM